jgi:hypothetical protein
MDRTIQVRIPAKERGFMFSRHVQTGCGAHTISCSMGTGVLSRRGVKLTTHSHLVHRLRQNGAIRILLPYPFMAQTVKRLSVFIYR